MSNVKLKVHSWVSDGFPSKYGLELEGQRYLTLKKNRWAHLHQAWLRMMKPAAFYNTKTDTIEFTSLFNRQIQKSNSCFCTDEATFHLYQLVEAATYYIHNQGRQKTTINFGHFLNNEDKKM